MTSSTRTRALAASLALGVSAALLATLPGPASADPAGPPAFTNSAGSRTAAAPTQAQPQAQPAEKKRKHKRGKVVWDRLAITPGTPIAAHGKVPGRGKVKLQVKIGGGWKTIGTVRADRRGKFAVSVPLDWYGAHKVRVTSKYKLKVKGKKRKRTFKKGATASVGIPYVPRGNPADTLPLTGDYGLPYTFDPCQTVRYAVNADDVGPNGLLLAQLGMAQLSWATGIKVQYVGASHQIPFQVQGREDELPAGQDLLIAFATEQEVPQFVTRPAIGLGGAVQASWGRNGQGKHVIKTQQAAVVLDTDAYFDTSTYDQGFFGTKPNFGEVMLHEIGHAFGLEHVNAKDEIMYPGAGNGAYPDGTFRGLYDNGDLAGLAKNGLGQGCVRKANGPRLADGTTMKVTVPAPRP